MFIHCKQCAVKAHLPNGRYVIEVTIPARKRKAIKDYIGGPVIGWIEVNEPERVITAITIKNFRFHKYYRLEEYIDFETMQRKYVLAQCVTR